jgi:3-methyladenine DNA glycosylase AlkD
MWLNQSAILFQLGYKDKTDFDLLKAISVKHKSSSEFFYSKKQLVGLYANMPKQIQAVKKFVTANNLKPLSRSAQNLNYT